jgi:hypothetical protein
MRPLFLAGAAIAAAAGWLVWPAAPARHARAPAVLGTRPQAEARVVSAAEDSAPAINESETTIPPDLVVANAAFERRPRAPDSALVAEMRTRSAGRAAERLGVRVVSAECRGGLCRAELVQEREACAGRRPQRISGAGGNDLFRFCETGTWRSVAFFPDSEATKGEGSNR